MGFSGKVAIVTGAGGGIGEGYAKALAEWGCAVAVADINEAGAQRVAEAIVAAGGKAIAVKVDVSSEDSTKAMATTVAGELGGIDYLINNAAIYGGMQLHTMMDVPYDYWKKFMSVNMDGCFLATRAVAPYMEQRGGGAIINQSSSAAWLSRAGYYGIAKLALNGITQNMAMELGPKNIRINGIAPGPTDTEATRTSTAEGLVDSIVATLALARMGQVKDMVDACRFLLSDEAGWITGQILCVDGGFIMRP
ncbi:SDR family oxidoreductase [Flavisphingomonas formosensis]|uniref:SDR family oxidoreductase n=1 Tax=Flavisphingomonas formosensis TaxID=861534 RepID=UPI0012FB208F|nr:SDR family oxidoreductase [Sphingomonas formosensis]